MKCKHDKGFNKFKGGLYCKLCSELKSQCGKNWRKLKNDVYDTDGSLI